MQTVAEIRALLQAADGEELAVLERALVADTRKGVAHALEAARRRIASQQAEMQRVDSLYRFQEELAGVPTHCILGLDEVGRGPLAGPLTVGGVVLADTPHIEGLNDSKQIPEQRRAAIAEDVRSRACAFTIQHVPAQEIDEFGMAACLRKAFRAAIDDIESRGFPVQRILLDGNPLNLDDREVNVVKGDARCASIAAASIVAKVERDALMARYAEMYASYGFEKNKGYGSAAHIDAIARFGLSPVHRRSFCHFSDQLSLF